MDYTRLAMLEALKNLDEQTSQEIREMMNESKFLQECYENHSIAVMEATNDDVFHSIIVAFQKFCSKLGSKFRAASIKRFYKNFDDESFKNIRANMEKIKSNCLKLDVQKTTPLWNADYRKDSDNLRKALNQAFDNVSSGKFDDYSFASTFVSDTNLAKKKNTDVTNYLKNYFRYGKNNLEQPQSVTITGKELVDKLDSIIKFMEKYNTDIASLPGKVSDNLNSRLKEIKIFDGSGEGKSVSGATPNEINDAKKEGDDKAGPVQDWVNITPTTYLKVEQKMVCETMLPLFMGYNTLLEKTEDGNTANDKNNDSGKDKGKTVDNSVTKDDVKVTQGIQDKDPNKANDNKEDKNSKSSNAGKEYLDEVVFFFESAISAYSTSLEERFVAYASILRKVASDYMKKDDNEGDNTNNNGKDNAVKKAKNKITSKLTSTGDVKK